MRLLNSGEANLHESVKEARGKDTHDHDGHAFFCPPARVFIMNVFIMKEPP